MRVPAPSGGPRRRRGAKEALPRCGRSFRASTGRVLGTTKQPAATWARYAEAMLGGRHAAQRRRVRRLAQDQLLDAPPPGEVMASMLPGLRGGPGLPVEADETLVPDSLSGNHSRSAGFPCPAPHAGAGRRAAAGVSSDKVSVLTMVNARGDAMAVAACRGKMGSPTPGAPWRAARWRGGGLHRPPARLCARLAEMGRGGPRGSPPPARAPLNRVNALHSALKAFLARFGGVSTRRLPQLPRVVLLAREARRSGDAASLLGRRWGRGHTGRAGAGSGGSRARSTRRFPCHMRVNTALTINVRQRRPFILKSSGNERKGRLWRTF